MLIHIGHLPATHPANAIAAMTIAQHTTDTALMSTHAHRVNRPAGHGVQRSTYRAVKAAHGCPAGDGEFTGQCVPTCDLPACTASSTANRMSGAAKATQISVPTTQCNCALCTAQYVTHSQYTDVVRSVTNWDDSHLVRAPHHTPQKNHPSSTPQGMQTRIVGS